jgi:DNA adenine methylase
MYSVLNYIGKKEIDLHDDMQILNIETYCEPFSGSFNTGFKLIDTRYKAKYILNDLDKYVYNFWTCLKYNEEELEDLIHSMIAEMQNSIFEEETITEDKAAEKFIFKKLTSTNKMEKAAAEFIYRQMLTLQGIRYNSYKVEKSLNCYDMFVDSEALKEVHISNRDYSEVLAIYDDIRTFYLIDPPYTISNSGSYYRCNSKEFNHDKLAEQVKSLKAKWLLTYDYNEEILEKYKEYNVEIKERAMFGRVYRELYIRNYTI